MLLLVRLEPEGLVEFPSILWAQNTPILILLALTGGMNLLAVPLAYVLPEDLQAQFLPAVLNGLGASWLLLVVMFIIVLNIAS